MQDALQDLRSGYERFDGFFTGAVRLAKGAVEKGTSAVAFVSGRQQEPAQTEATDT